MYFGDFLVMKQIITTEQLLKALCYQVESLPSMIRIVWEKNIVNPNDLLKILKSNLRDDYDLIKYLKDKNLISDSKIQELEMIQFEKRTPLGEALVQLNIVSLEVINSALKEYYDNKFNLNEPSVEDVKEDSSVEISAAALESLKELGMSLEQAPIGVVAQSFKEKPFLDQYKDVFSDKLKNKLVKLLEMVKNELSGSSDISNYFNSIYKDFHLLKSTVILSELSTQEELISYWEEKIEKVLTKPNDEIRDWCKVNLSNLHRLIDTLWYSRDQILKNKSDESLASDEEFISKSSQIFDV